MSKQIAIGPYQLSGAAVRCLRRCLKENPSQSRYHTSTLRALARRGLVRCYSVGSYMDGGAQFYVEITGEGRRLIEAHPIPIPSQGVQP